MGQNANRKVLLIGAGFSKNFGGYLAEEVFLKIFNHSNLTENLKNHLLKYINEYNFEQYYEDVFSLDAFTEEERKQAHNILVEIYRDMDNKFQRRIIYPVNFSYLGIISFLINNFSFSNNGCGYIFSLNQDLLLERLFADYLKWLKFYQPGGWGGEYQGALLPQYGPINSPFYKYHKDDNKAYQTFDRLEEADYTNIEKWLTNHRNTYEDVNRKIPCLVKLHGSFYWRNLNDEALWVIGTKSKELTIQSTPILALYFDKFLDIMSKSDIELYIIGYSFRDSHINKIIAESCQAGTRLIVVDVIPFKLWCDKIKVELEKIDIKFNLMWLKKYINQPFQDLFPITSNENTIKFDGNHDTSLEKLINIQKSFY